VKGSLSTEAMVWVRWVGVRSLGNSSRAVKINGMGESGSV